MKKAHYYTGILNAVQEPILVFDRELRIVDRNEAAEKAFGEDPAAIRDCPCHHETRGPAPACAKTGGACIIRQVFETGRFARAIRRHPQPDGSPMWEEILASPVRNEEGGIEYVVEELRDLTDILRHRSLVKELQAQVRHLEGILPICGHCKKIRNKSGSWEEVEVYVRNRTDANFSHSICPDCFAKHYAEFSV